MSGTAGSRRTLLRSPSEPEKAKVMIIANKELRVRWRNEKKPVKPSELKSPVREKSTIAEGGSAAPNIRWISTKPVCVAESGRVLTKLSFPPRERKLCCYICGSEDGDCGGGLKECSTSGCSVKFHLECAQSHSGGGYTYNFMCRNKGIHCPRHHCASCFADHNRVRCFNGKLISCNQCELSWHADGCIPGGCSVDPRTKEIVCPRHVSFVSPPLLHTAHCSDCQQRPVNGEKLTRCATCLRSFHPQCKESSPGVQNGSNVIAICNWCRSYDFVRYGQHCMGRLGGLKWFPCQVVRNDEYVDQKDPLLGSVGYVAVKWLPHRGQTFFSLLSHNRVIPMSEADYFFVTEAESSGIYEAWKKAQDHATANSAENRLPRPDHISFLYSNNHERVKKITKLRDSQAMKDVIICGWCGEEKRAGKMLKHLRKCTCYHYTDGLSDEMRDVFSNPEIKVATAEEWAIHYPVEPGTKKSAIVYAVVRHKRYFTSFGMQGDQEGRSKNRHKLDSDEELVLIARGFSTVAASTLSAFLPTMADVTLPDEMKRTKTKRFEFKNMVLPPAYEEKIRREEMTYVQAHKAMRELAYRVAKGMLSDDQLKLLKFPEWPMPEGQKDVIICPWCGEEKSASKMLRHLRGESGYIKCDGYHYTDGLSDEMRDVFSNPDIKAATAEEWAIHYPVEPGTKKGARVYAAVRKKGHITYVGSTINPKERAHANYNIDACEEILTIAEGIPEVAARAGEAFSMTMTDLSLLPKGKRRTKNKCFEFKSMVLPAAYVEKIRREEMTYVQAHKAMRELAYRLVKGMLSDDRLKLLKFSEWPTLEEMKAGGSTTLNDTSDEGEEDETADEKSCQNPTEETPTAQREQVEVARHDDAHSLSAAQDLLLEINMLTQATDPNDSIDSAGMRGIELIEEATGITPKMKEITIEALRYASRQRRRSIRAASAQSDDRSNEGAAGPVEEVSQQLNREDLGNRMSQGHESRKRKRMQEVLDDAGTTPKQSRLDGARMHANGGRGLEHRNEDSDVSLEEDESGADSGDDYDSGDDGPDKNRYTTPETRPQKDQLEVASLCHCPKGKDGRCGPASECINRALRLECPEECDLLGKCHNRAISSGQNCAPLSIISKNGRYFGAVILQDIEQDGFIGEYVGEVISWAEKERRLERIGRFESLEAQYYIIDLDNHRAIDAEFYGNDMRFVNHSCRPNTCVDIVTTANDVHIALYALRPITKGEELSFDYNMYSNTSERTVPRCRCRALNCTGVLAAKKITLKSTVETKGESGKENVRRKKRSVSEAPNKPPPNSRPKSTTTGLVSRKRPLTAIQA